jgi:hypothetical protein
MNVDEIDPSAYNHIHFAFATIITDWKVDISQVYGQFDKFVKMLTNRNNEVSFAPFFSYPANGSLSINTHFCTVHLLLPSSLNFSTLLPPSPTPFYLPTPPHSPLHTPPSSASQYHSSLESE